mgnify:CR=1 FL=1
MNGMNCMPTLFLTVIWGVVSVFWVRLQTYMSAKKRSDLLYQQANTDPLTGLFNRNALNEHIYAVLADSALKNAAVMIIDLDNFKSVNDNFGHLYGDGVLKEISREIRERVRETDTIGRIGGDEFVVFMENYGDESVLEKRADAFCRALRKYYEEDDVECTISGSIGIACFPRDGKTYDELLGKADQALYYIKKSIKMIMHFIVTRFARSIFILFYQK